MEKAIAAIRVPEAPGPLVWVAAFAASYAYVAAVVMGLIGG